jgi:flagellar basal body-associated protein FliL
MSQGNLSVAEIREEKSAPQDRKKKLRFPFLAGAVVLVALAMIGVEVWSSKTKPLQTP